MKINEIKLIDNFRIVIRSLIPMKKNVEIWCIIVSFVSDFPEKNKFLKEYYIWVTGEYLEDKLHLPADINSAQKFALEFAKKRFEKSGNQIPIENGVFCSNKEGIAIVDPKFFVYQKRKTI